MNHNLNNTVVLSLNPEHGAEVIKAWKALGVDTRDYEGFSIINPYYGIDKDGDFNCYSALEVNNEKMDIITLSELQAMAEPQLTFPREMMVSDTLGGLERKTIPSTVLGMFNGRYVVDDGAENEWYIFRYAREIE